MKNNKGITLIALIITIIVMLILVAVTITIAVNGGLFNYARDAAVKTNTRVNEEQEYANLGNYEDKGFSTDYEYLIDKYAVKKIHFTLDYNNGEEPIECTAEKGMTWEDWYKSDYAKNNSNLDYSKFEYSEEDKYLSYDSLIVFVDSDGTVEDTPETEIIDGTTYYLL